LYINRASILKDSPLKIQREDHCDIEINMAPSAVSPVEDHPLPLGHSTKSKHVEPLQSTGALDASFKFEEVTPAIGREYPTANIVDDLLDSSNADKLLRDLAITSKLICEPASSDPSLV
jgi:hypothetical protein